MGEPAITEAISGLGVIGFIPLGAPPYGLASHMVLVSLGGTGDRRGLGRLSLTS